MNLATSWKSARLATFKPRKLLLRHSPLSVFTIPIIFLNNFKLFQEWTNKQVKWKARLGINKWIFSRRIFSRVSMIVAQSSSFAQKTSPVRAFLGPLRYIFLRERSICFEWWSQRRRWFSDYDEKSEKINVRCQLPMKRRSAQTRKYLCWKFKSIDLWEHVNYQRVWITFRLELMKKKTSVKC